MARVTDIVSASGTKPVFMCDFSPPRNPSPNWLDQASSLNPDIFNVPYLAPHPTRPGPITAARLIRDHTGTEVAFNLATRDSSESLVLEKLSRARELGLENVVVLQGDADRGVADVSRTKRFRPTELIRELKGRGDEFCVGAVADLAKNVEREADLSLRKVDAGADFLLIQPTLDFEAMKKFLSHDGLDVPLFHGVQVLVKGAIAFMPLPDSLQDQIEHGDAGVQFAVDTVRHILGLDIRCFYLIPPVFPGGARDYGMARQVMASFAPRPTPDSPV